MRSFFRTSLSRRLKSIGSFGLLSVLMGCTDIVPMSTIHPLTEWGRDINHVYLITTIICVLVFLMVAGPLVYTLIRFRERPGDTHIPKQIHGNTVLELTWTTIPVILLLFIFIPTWQTIFKHAREPSPDALKVQVIGHQWWWEFVYPDLGINTANELVLPENREVVFEITSADVIHSFWVPRFGGKLDALPGVTHIMVIDTPAGQEDRGDYYQGQCVELCGSSHALMRFQAVVLKADAFERWAKTHNEPPRLETSKEKRGLELMTSKGCLACHAIAGTDLVGITGPNLSNMGSRRTLGAGTLLNNRDDMARWLRNPEEIKPGSIMPNLGLTDDEISDLSAFLRNSTIKQF